MKIFKDILWKRIPIFLTFNYRKSYKHFTNVHKVLYFARGKFDEIFRKLSLVDFLVVSIFVDFEISTDKIWIQGPVENPIILLLNYKKIVLSVGYWISNMLCIFLLSILSERGINSVIFFYLAHKACKQAMCCFIHVCIQCI